ncbi:hypothetical protein B0H14DRAFT_3451095 [Mycena olivaceomarginata]|nr:hypothetical protein B0H14DRAFT_3451095 [Mycena olivaceomarginata]
MPKAANGHGLIPPVKKPRTATSSLVSTRHLPPLAPNRSSHLLPLIQTNLQTTTHACCFRVRIATQNRFPSDRTEFAWGAISDAVTVSDVPELVEGLAAAENSDERQAQLTTYVCVLHSNPFRS